MPHDTLKLTAEVAEAIRARVKSLDFTAIEKISKAKDQNGTFDVIISTEDTDRSGEIVKQNGWELTNYKNNPIVLWGHDYYSLPVGVCTETYLIEKNGVPALGAKGVFLSADINPFAQQVRKLYEFGIGKGAGVGCTTSVGFIPKEFDEKSRNTITKAELLEFSFVPIPANQGVGPAQGRALSFAEARELGIDMAGMRVKGVNFSETVGFVPHEKSLDAKAPENETLAAPALKDFTDKSWDELSHIERLSIAGHFAWCPDRVPKSFDDLTLPYRRATDGAVVLNGLRAAMRSLTDQVTIEGDRKAVYDHLAPLFKLFGKDAPEFATLKEAQQGDECTMDDGTPGVFSTDSDGALVCMPKEEKSAEEDRTSQKSLLKALGDEHGRHVGEIEKALDDLGTKPDKDTVKDVRASMSDEHTMHRAKTIACFRAFNPAEDKAFDKNEHLKSLRGEHDTYEQKCMNALDEFEKKSTKTVQGDEGHDNDFTEWITGKMDTLQRAHKKAITKIAKGMCKEAFGEEDQADEKVLEILREHLASFVPEPLQRAVFQKVGARISSATKEKLGEAHQHMKAATAIVEALHGALGNDDGEESRSGDEGKTQLQPAPAKKRSRPAEGVRDDELNAHLLTKDILRGITTAAQRGLEKLNKEGRK